MIAALEGLLFICGDEGLTLKQISEVLDINKNEAKDLVQKLYNDLDNPNRGIKMEYLGGKFKLTTKIEHSKFYEKLVYNEQEKKLSESALQVLSIIAYNQPISRVQVDKIRGISSAYIFRKLLIKNLIEECGKSEEPGKPTLYKVTNIFLDYFGLGSIKDLPEIKKIEIEVDSTDKDLFQTKYNEEIEKL